MILSQNLFLEGITTIRRYQLVKKYFLGLLHFNPCLNLSNEVFPVCIRKHIKKGVGNKYLQEHRIYTVFRTSIIVFLVMFLVCGFLVGFSFLYFMFLLPSFLYVYYIAVIIIDFIYTRSYFEQVF